MHWPSGLTSLVAFLALLAKVGAKQSAPFELKSHVLHPPNPTLDGLYLTAVEYHPGPFFFAAIGVPSEAYPALVSVLTGTRKQLAAGNGSFESFGNNDIQFGNSSFDIAPGSVFLPSSYDYVAFVEGGVSFGWHFVNHVLKWKDVKGDFYACLQNPPLPPEEIDAPQRIYRLLYKPAGNPTPANCSTLQLIREPTS